MKHIVFDVDGTLIDTELASLYSLRDTMQMTTGKKYSAEELTFSLGLPAAVTLIKLGIDNVAEVLALWEDILGSYSNIVEAFPGIWELLDTLKARGHRIGIVTSRTKKEFRCDVEPLGIAKPFETIICADDTQRHKPEPDSLLKYAELAGTDISNVVYIGDSPYDMGCANSAGAKFILAGWGTKQPMPVKEQFRAETPAEVLEFI